MNRNQAMHAMHSHPSNDAWHPRTDIPYPAVRTWHLRGRWPMAHRCGTHAKENAAFGVDVASHRIHLLLICKITLQAVPRTVLFDTKTRSNLLQWPVEEVEKLRTSNKSFSGITIDAGSLFPLDITGATRVISNAEKDNLLINSVFSVVAQKF